MISAKPNHTFVRASVVAKQLADDGWGAWAELRIEQASDPDMHVGEQIRVFVPPPLVSKVEKQALYEGPMTFRQSRQGGFFALVPT
jgi:hypothetical protein